ncbi:MAG TPA: amino acid ABC transporter permease [Spirochaetales bacterium]|nr:amino acid ABC transporter permease [Spirochaetales bacterium]HPB67052.1 amino acid ABC transporter permease [Spirochaetales bacterium]HPG86317.1 amino acid ABC transporter permease [Spirochaetales bacterium]HPM72239.1 amino acid ABC transporter permease [Spirochaetales bacterium]
MGLDLDYLARTLLLSLRGLPVTLGLCVATLVVSLPLGFMLAIVGIYRVRVLRKLASVYISFARGTPIVLQILVVYSVLPSLANQVAIRAGWDVDVFALNPLWYAVVVFSFNTTAVLSEIVRSAILTVDRGQYEAALSSGMTSRQAYRRIIVPQALLVALPNLANATINLIKGTSLAFLMAVRDVTAIAKIEAARGYDYVESYLAVFIVYVFVCGATQALFTLIERRLGIYRAPVVAF